MKVYALVGKSGTGKSYKALSVAHEYNIDLVIDDGLLINGSRLLGGKSAKREHTTIGAVKRAIFHHHDHKQEVQRFIDPNRYASILILGTSKRMVDKIARNLELGSVDEYIDINDISTERDLELAYHNRNRKGKHIIPLPTLELKKDFSGYILDKVKHILWPGSDSQAVIGEKTVTRPTFSYYGKFTISDNTIRQIAIITSRNFEDVFVDKVRVTKHQEAISMNVNVSTKYGIEIQKEILKFQQEIVKNISHMTLINIVKCNVKIKDIEI